MDKKPNFFILGAPKCGTTSVAAWLAEHPEVFFSPQKETRYFSRDLRLFNRVQNYEALFDGVQEHHLACGEASTDYFYSDVAIPDILEYQPSAKFIVMLRRPDELIWAWHKQLLFGSLQKESSFDNSWRGFSKPAKGYDSRMVDYKFIGRLGEHVERILKQAPRDRTHFILLDDLARQPGKTFSDLLYFLGLPKFRCSNLAAKNVGIERRFKFLSDIIRIMNKIRIKTGFSPKTGIISKIDALNKVGRRDTIARAVSQEIIDYFSSDIDDLQRLISRDLSKWKVTSSTSMGRK